MKIMSVTCCVTLLNKNVHTQQLGLRRTKGHKSSAFTWAAVTQLLSEDCFPGSPLAGKCTHEPGLGTKCSIPIRDVILVTWCMFKLSVDTEASDNQITEKPSVFKKENLSWCG